MTKKLLIFGLVLMTLFNLVAIGTFIYLHLNRPDLPFEEPDGFIDKMDLNPEQFKALRESQREFFESVRPFGDSIIELKKEMVDEMVKDDPDTVLICNLVDRIGGFQTKMHGMAIKSMMNYSKNLPKETRKRMIRNFEKRSDYQFQKFGHRHGKGRPGMGPPMSGPMRGKDGRRMPWMNDSTKIEDSLNAR